VTISMSGPPALGSGLRLGRAPQTRGRGLWW